MPGRRLIEADDVMVEGGDTDNPFSDKAIRKAFIRKVWTNFLIF